MSGEHEVTELAADYEIRSYIMAGFTWLDFVVKNEGTCKASDVTLEIEVPDGLMVFETVDLGLCLCLMIIRDTVSNGQSIHK